MKIKGGFNKKKLFSNSKKAFVIGFAIGTILISTVTYAVTSIPVNSKNATYNSTKSPGLVKISATNVQDALDQIYSKRKSFLLSEARVGSYVKYVGNNGCSGNACKGYNAHYKSDTDMGYCEDSNYKYRYNGWRVAYIQDSTAYLVSAGAPECLCTNKDGTTSSSSCKTYAQSDTAKGHLDNLHLATRKYCNKSYSYGGVCDSTSTWAFKYVTTLKIITGMDTSTAYAPFPYGSNDLVDIGGYYWMANSIYNLTKNAGDKQRVFNYDPQVCYTNDVMDSCAVYGVESGFAYGVRPILRLKASVKVTGGKGTYKEPYTISPS